MKKKFLTLFGIITFIFLFIPNIYAIELVQAGDTVTQEGEYDSIRLAAGNKVVNKANVDGISLVAGNNITLEGSAPYGFYAGNIVTFNEKIEKDAFVAGNMVAIDSDAVIGRDLFVAGEDITIKSNITRNLYVGGDSVDLSGVKINGDAYIDAANITMDEETVISGKLNYLEDAKIIGIVKDNIGEIKTHKGTEYNIEYNFTNILYDFLFSVIAAFIVMIVLFYIIPNTKNKLDELELDAGVILKTIGVGALVLLVIPFAAIIALFTGVLTPLALIVVAIYVIAIYLASLLSAYVVGRLITNKVFKNESVYLALVIGIILVKVVKFIPLIGGLCVAVFLAYGMGLIYKYIISLRK